MTKKTNKIAEMLKNNKKVLGFAFVGIMVGGALGSTISNVHASQLDGFDYSSDYDLGYTSIESSSDYNNMSFEEMIELEKEEFQQEYGTEDKFQTVYEDDEFKEEVNGATGAIRYTYKATGEIEEYNYFEELEKDLAYSQMTDEERMAADKEEFQQEYGTEDKFQTVYEDDEFKEEVNGATGVVRYTDKTTGEVEEYNYFEELEKDLAYSQMTDEERMAADKEEFQQEYGTEDKFQTVYEDDEFKEEVNGATGVIRYTDKTTGEVEEYNYFEECNEEVVY